MYGFLVPVDGSQTSRQALLQGMGVSRCVVDRAPRWSGARIAVLDAQDAVPECPTRGCGRDSFEPHRQAHARQATEAARARSLGVRGTRGLGSMEAPLPGANARETIHVAEVPVTVVR